MKFLFDLKNTALAMAIDKGSVEIVKLLLKAGHIKVNQKIILIE